MYGRSARQGAIGIQCKRLADLDENGAPYPGGPIGRALLFDEAAKSLAFKVDLKLWILATTARRDIRVQGWVDELNDEWNEAGRNRFAVVWSWDECVSHLNSYPELQRRYYRDVIQVRAPADLDAIILGTIRMAFSRPAFEVPLHAETAEDFVQALKDTQQALRTGELVDRESRHVIRRAIGGYKELDAEQARNGLRVVDLDLRHLRSRVEQGLQDGSIRKGYGYLNFRDAALAHELDRVRAQCVRGVDRVLADAGLPPI